MKRFTFNPAFVGPAVAAQRGVPLGKSGQRKNAPANSTARFASARKQRPPTEAALLTYGVLGLPRGVLGLPRFAKVIPRASAALRSRPAFFKASIFSGPQGIDRAASKASSASASKSRSSCEGLPVMGAAQGLNARS